MARGRSGRVVVEIDPSLKNELYLALGRDQKTLKEWFTLHAAQFVVDQQQPGLFAQQERAMYGDFKSK